MADENNVDAIIMKSATDENAYLLAGNRPNQNIYYLVDSDQVYHELHHLYGIQAMKSTSTSEDKIIQQVSAKANLTA